LISDKATVSIPSGAHGGGWEGLGEDGSGNGALYLKDRMICAAGPIVGGFKEVCLLGRRAKVSAPAEKGRQRVAREQASVGRRKSVPPPS